MTLQSHSNIIWQRRVQLLIGQDDGQWLDVSELRIRFHVEQALVGKPGHAVITVNNMANDTAQRIQREGAPVILQAGHEGNAGLIFRGTAIQIRRGRESQTDTFLEITAIDGDVAYMYATVNVSMAAGWTHTDQLKEMQKGMRAKGVDPGYTGELYQNKAVRGKALFGAVRDHMHDFSVSTGTEWAINMGKMDVVPVGGILPDEAFLLTPDTGLIGMPTQSVDGIHVRALLNPCFRAGAQVKLQNSSIVMAQINPAYADVTYNAPIDLDGAYKIYSVSHVGDTRGNDYYTDMICTGLNTPPPLSDVFRETVGNRGY